MASGKAVAVILSKKLWDYSPAADANGYTALSDTVRYAFGVAPSGVHFGDIAGADGFVDASKLIGGVRWVSGAKGASFELPPGAYRLYEFAIVRTIDGELKFAKRGGWDYSAEINSTPIKSMDDDGGIEFEVRSTDPQIALCLINKSVSIRLKKTADGSLKPGVLFFGTSSYLGLAPFPRAWNDSAVIRVGLTDALGEAHLDGFVSGNNVFIHEVISKADYEAGVRATQMEVYRLDGSLWFSAPFPDVHQVDAEERDRLLSDPRFSDAARALIEANLQVGDYLCSNQNYFYERHGTLQVKVSNAGKPPKIELSKKIWAGVPGSDANGYSSPDGTVQYAFGVVRAGTKFAQITGPDGYVDEAKLIGGIRWVIGAEVTRFSLPPGRYDLFEFVIWRHGDGTSLKFGFRNGWDFTMEVDGVRTTTYDDDGAIPFEVKSADVRMTIMGINKSLCVAIEATNEGKPKPGALFFGTSSYLGLAADSQNGNAGAVVRLGVSDEQGRMRLDGFVTGNNIFIHEVISKAEYDVGMRGGHMDVYGLDGNLTRSAELADIHVVTEQERAQLLRDPKFTPAGRRLIEQRLQAGDYLCTTQSYFNERQGVMLVKISHRRLSKVDPIVAKM